jgi:hypothetical protein
MIPLKSIAFWGGLLGAFTAAHNVKSLVHEYQSVDMHFIVVPVKFDGGLSMSILRNKQLFYQTITSLFHADFGLLS